MASDEYPPSAEKMMDAGSVKENPLSIPPAMADLWNILPFVENGWNYHTHTEGRISWLMDKRIPQADSDTITIHKGGGRYAPKLPYDPKDYPQWLMGVFTWFSNPNGVMLLKMGNHQYSVSPLSLDTFAKPTFMSRLGASQSVMQHISAYGPIYGLSVDPPAPLPIPPHDFRLEYYLCPDTCITDEAEIVALIVARVVVTDTRDFLNSLQKASAGFILGGRMNNWLPRWKR